jgi:hypothetical protein
MWAMPKLLTVAVAVGVAFFATAATAAAQTTYSGIGYDISYPQCNSNGTPSTSLPAGSFGIVGVNHGRPFTTYSSNCFSALYTHAAASGTPSLYINLAYSGAYRRNINPSDCSAGPSMAWEIGCSEADSSFIAAGTRAVTMWWLDVETANSWSSSDVTLNQNTIQGAIDFLMGKGFQVGVYSTVGAWQTITGRTTVYTPNHTVAAWVAGQAGACPTNGATSFDANPIWLSQFTNGFDYDNAC